MYKYKLPFQGQLDVEGDGSASINVENVEHRGAGRVANQRQKCVCWSSPKCICRREMIRFSWFLPAPPLRASGSVSSRRPTASTVPLVSSIGAVPHVLGNSRGRPLRDYAASINAILDVGLEAKSYHYVKVATRYRTVSSRFLSLEMRELLIESS